jgi:hypothetical protein
MKKMVFWVFAGILFLGGCATGMIEGKKLPQVGDDYAAVFIMRKPTFIGGGNATTIKYNGESLLYLNAGKCVTFNIPTGKTILSGMNVGGWLIPYPYEKKVEFNAVKGESYYFLADTHMGATINDFDQLTKEQWEKASTKCEWFDLEKSTTTR